MSEELSIFHHVEYSRSFAYSLVLGRKRTYEHAAVSETASQLEPGGRAYAGTLSVRLQHCGLMASGDPATSKG